jgi:hypothetical protein
MRKYEEMLAREHSVAEDQREEIGAAAVASAPGSGSGGGYESGGYPAGEGEGEGEGGGGYPSGGVSGGGSPGEMPSDEAGGGVPARAGGGGGAAEIPPGVPDGSDDDIVARQLRELAMKEKDPALREKLWQEYIAYKTGTGGPGSKSQEAPAKEEQSDGEDDGQGEESAQDGSGNP